MHQPELYVKLIHECVTNLASARLLASSPSFPVVIKASLLAAALINNVFFIYLKKMIHVYTINVCGN